MKPTLKSLAAELSIDPSLISRVLRGSATARISDAKRQLILETAQRVGYRPDRLAKSLKAGATRIVAMVTPDITNPFHSQLFRGVEKAARDAGYSVILYHMSDVDEPGTGLVESLTEGLVDGFLVASARSPDDRIDVLRQSGLPCVLLNRPSGDARDLWVGPDDYHTGALGAQILAGHGHRRIAVLLGDVRMGNMRERSRGFVDAAKRLGLSLDDVAFHPGLDSPASVRQALAGILRAPAASRATAIFSPHSVFARIAFEECFRRGVAVPGEISLLGYGAEKGSPLSSIFVSAEDIGAQALKVLVSELAFRAGDVGRRLAVPAPFEPSFLAGHTLAGV